MTQDTDKAEAPAASLEAIARGFREFRSLTDHEGEKAEPCERAATLLRSLAARVREMEGDKGGFIRAQVAPGKWANVPRRPEAPDAPPSQQKDQTNG